MAKNNSKIYQLDELISDIYNTIYAKAIKYQTKFFNIADLKMNRFKLSDYDLDTIFSKTNIVYAGNFPTGMRTNPNDPKTEIEQIWFKRQGESHMTTIRLVPYADKEAVNNMRDPVNVQQILKTVLSEFVTSDRTNNILLPIINIDVQGSDLAPYDKVKTHVNSNKFYSIQITEKFYSLTTLENFMKNYPLELPVLKSIIYQIVDVLYQINISYPKFRYNQTVPAYIDCYLKKNGNFIYPEIKLSDFYLAEIHDSVHNDYLKEANIPFVDTPYSDLYQFLNNLFENYVSDIKKYPELVKFFDEFLPKSIRGKNNYLTKEIWNTLSDSDKENLKLKNIKNSPHFTTKDTLINTSFISPESIENNEISTGGNSEIDIEILETEGRISKSSEMFDELDDDSTENKKSNNDIDNMGHNKSGKRNKKNESDEYTEEYTEDMTSEQPSRIVRVTGSDYDMGSGRHTKGHGKDHKQKIYHGKRMIGNSNEESQHMMFNPNRVDSNQFVDNSGMQARINSIGSMFGVSPEEYGQMNSMGQAKYPQFSQDAQYAPMPGQMPSNWVPGQGQGMPQMQRSDGEALAKYMTLMGQNQDAMSMFQQPNSQMMPQISNSSGQKMDPNMMAMLMQQNQQIPQMPQMSQMSQVPQIGGGRKNFNYQDLRMNPFFFQ